ncbi:MAG: hypothetical protein GOVbin1096_24 [Prokaryotic dsDNA virus sp.]|jgi:hypothetical protein|nr:MAG: hypothetical protein GOVbin1096_24 [Prokaryotic dsDNA virus sp.]|tara:strand:+ start:49995 stop:50210 length:216 start_codon:yes stop_codon:yes gene_type:complete
MSRLDKRQAAIVGAYTGILCGPFSDLHEFIEEIMGRPVWTHELGSVEVAEEVKEKAKPYFLEICYESTNSN